MKWRQICDWKKHENLCKSSLSPSKNHQAIRGLCTSSTGLWHTIYSSVLYSLENISHAVHFLDLFDEMIGRMLFPTFLQGGWFCFQIVWCEQFSKTETFLLPESTGIHITNHWDCFGVNVDVWFSTLLRGLWGEQRRAVSKQKDKEENEYKHGGAVRSSA